MQHGAERMCMPAPSVDQFVHAVKQTVLANKRWVLIQLAKQLGQDHHQLRAGHQGAGGRQAQGVHGRALPRRRPQSVPRGGLLVQRLRRQGRRRRHTGHPRHHPARDHAQERHRARRRPRIQGLLLIIPRLQCVQLPKAVSQQQLD
jgi:hypothetical protein